MAVSSVSTNTTTGFSGSFTNGVVSRIEAQAYKEMYDMGVLPKLVRRIGQGQKGSAFLFPYFDPSTIAAAASSLTETNDFLTTTALTNASVIVIASELGVRSDVTDALKESAAVDIPGEIARQHAISCAVKMEKHILGRMSGGFTTNASVCGTNATNGFTYSHYAAAKSKLRAAALTVPGRLTAVVPEYSWFKTAQSTFSQTYASTMGKPGEQVLGNFYVDTLWGDVDVYRHSLAFVSATSYANGYMFASDAIGLWTPRDFRLEKQRDASARADEIVSTLRAGAKVLINAYGLNLKMYAKAPSV